MEKVNEIPSVRSEKTHDVNNLLEDIKSRIFEDTKKALKKKRDRKLWWLGGKFGLAAFYSNLLWQYPFTFGRGEEHEKKIKQVKESLVELFLQTAKEMGYGKVASREQVQRFVGKNFKDIIGGYQKIVDSFLDETKILYTNSDLRKQVFMDTKPNSERFNRKKRNLELAKTKLRFELGKIIERELGLNREGKIDARIGTVKDLNRIKNGIIEGYFGFGRSGIAKLVGRDPGKLEVLKEFLINTFGSIKPDSKNWDELILSALHNITLESSEARGFIESRGLVPQTGPVNRGQERSVGRQNIGGQTVTSLGQVRPGVNSGGVLEAGSEGVGENQVQQGSQRIGWRERTRNAFAGARDSFEEGGGVKGSLGVNKAQEWLQRPTPVPSFRNLKIEARTGYVVKTSEAAYKKFFAKHAAWLRQEIQKPGRDFATCKQELQLGFLRDFSFDQNGLTEDSKLRIVDNLNNAGLRIFNTQSRQLVVDTPEKIKLIENLIGVHGTNINVTLNFDQAKEAAVSGLSYYMEAEIDKIEKENSKLAYTKGLVGKMVDTFRPLTNSGPGLAARQAGRHAAKSTGKFLLEQGKKGVKMGVEAGKRVIAERRARSEMTVLPPLTITGPGAAPTTGIVEPAYAIQTFTTPEQTQVSQWINIFNTEAIPQFNFTDRGSFRDQIATMRAAIDSVVQAKITGGESDISDLDPDIYIKLLLASNKSNPPLCILDSTTGNLEINIVNTQVAALVNSINGISRLSRDYRKSPNFILRLLSM